MITIADRLSPEASCSGISPQEEKVSQSSAKRQKNCERGDRKIKDERAPSLLLTTGG